MSDVVEEIKTIMDFWLNKKPVMGFHIGDFNILFEDWSKDTITTDIEASKEFINMMHNHSAVLTDNDKLDRYDKVPIFRIFIIGNYTQTYKYFKNNLLFKVFLWELEKMPTLIVQL